MAAKKTIGQKKAERDKALASKAPTIKAGGDRIDAIIAKMRKAGDGSSRIMRSSEIEKREYARRYSGIMALDVVLNGGLPKGALIEFGGPYSSGKTTLAMHCIANEQRTTGGAVCWVALEPFSKQWARKNGFFIPFCEDLVTNAAGEEEPIDSYENATPLEINRMEEAGITDPYAEVSPFVLIQEERGDVALDLALEAIASNEFAYVVVDSLGVAKNTKFFTDKGVQESGDFPREPKMLADYTARCLLLFNRKYDENNQQSKDGTRFNDTTVININQIVTAIGSSAYAPWKQQEMKGGEGMKHNHHVVVFVWRTQREDQKVDAPGGRKDVIAQQVNLYGLKSKIGPPFIQTDFDLYLQDHGDFSAGSIDRARDLLTFAVLTGHVERNGAWYTINAERFNGRAPAEQYLRDNPDVYVELYPAVLSAMRK